MKSYSSFVLAIIASLFVSQCHGLGTLSYGKCAEVADNRNFSLDRYLGTWYTYANIFNSFALGKKCSKAVYRQALNESGFPIINRMTIENTNVNILIPSWKTEANGYAEPVDPVEAPNKLAAFIKPQLFGMEFDANEGKYWVTDTDYTSYSFVYSCREVFNFLFIVKEEYFWILTRSKNPSATQVSSFKNKLEGDLNWNEDLFFNIQDCDD